MPKFSTLQKCVIAVMLAFAAFFVFSMMGGKGARSPAARSLTNAYSLASACREDCPH